MLDFNRCQTPTQSRVYMELDASRSRSISKLMRQSSHLKGHHVLNWKLGTCSRGSSLKSMKLKLIQRGNSKLTALPTFLRRMVGLVALVKLSSMKRGAGLLETVNARICRNWSRERELMWICLVKKRLTLRDWDPEPTWWEMYLRWAIC